MNLSKREFLQVLGAASVAGMGLAKHSQSDAASAGEVLYDIPRFGAMRSSSRSTFVSPASTWA
jgi:sulfur-oxidizing protein SoxB